jgi:hypothetical protein
MGIAIALFVLAACAPPPPTDSGIQGRVTAGPSCPVSRPDDPCPDQPYAATLSILASADRRLITSVNADQSGFYRVLLPAGGYIIRPESPAVMPHASEVIVLVQPHQFTLQDIQYDTGIR